MPGFLPGRPASLMLDVVVVAMLVVLPVLGWSIYQAKRRGRYTLHKRVQLGLATVLLVAVAAFELDIRLLTDWESLARQSRFFMDGAWFWGTPIGIVLAVHLVFAISTCVLWVYVVVQALRKFPSPPQPGVHSAAHRRWAWLAVWDMMLTAVTGWIFYWMAFKA